MNTLQSFESDKFPLYPPPEKSSKISRLLTNPESNDRSNQHYLNYFY